MVGYPISGPAAAGILPGRMHATPVRDDYSFGHVQSSVFKTTDLQDLPGMLGAPIMARYDSGELYPAAVTLGGRGETHVRAIDNLGRFLIEKAERLGDTQTQRPS